MWESPVQSQNQFIILLKQIYWYIHKYLCVCPCIYGHMHALVHMPPPQSCKFLLFALISRATLNRRCNIIEALAGEAMIQPRSQKVNYTVGEGGDN